MGGQPSAATPRISALTFRQKVRAVEEMERASDALRILDPRRRPPSLGLTQKLPCTCVDRGVRQLAVGSAVGSSRQEAVLCDAESLQIARGAYERQTS